MQTLVLALLLAAVFSLFISPLQKRLQALFYNRAALIWALPFLLTAIFCGAAAMVGVVSLPLSLMVLIYTICPVVSVRLSSGGKPHLFDFVAVLLIWLPLEFAAGGSLVPRPAQGFLHSVAYGIAILLGLVLFLGYRGLSGMKYNLPRNRRDFWLPLAGFAIVAPVLIVCGIAIGFIPMPHLPTQAGSRMAAAVGIIFAGTAVPEEILFRALIQNLLMQRFGRNWRVLLLASVIFGAAHLDNGPQPVPNWRYMIVATVAGWAYGSVFDSGSTVLSSAALHTMVDWTKHFFF
ncbi:MAG TPA: type II CAAX endopeptidase family protein [Bryobacteraceae bacterium]|nr:type II CAAX endopeptidase family protein [Bryobacteraceae bacterium]